MFIQGRTVSHGENDLTVVLDKSSVEVGESEEVLNVLKSFDWFDYLKGLHFFVCHFDSLARNHIAQEFDLVLRPLALVRCNAQPVIAQPSQHLTGGIV